MTECNQSTFGFAAHFSRQVVARFDGGTLTTDSGGLLLRETDRRLNLLPRLAKCFLDARNPVFVDHSLDWSFAHLRQSFRPFHKGLEDFSGVRIQGRVAENPFLPSRVT